LFFPASYMRFWGNTKLVFKAIDLKISLP